MAEAPVKEIRDLSLSKESYPLHLIRDKKTEMYIKFAKVLVICQGPYDAARENYLSKIEERYPSACCILSDDTFAKETRRAKCIVDASEEYFEYFKGHLQHALELGKNLIVINNTVSNLSLNKYFCAAANKTQYVVLTIPPVVTERAVEWPPKSMAAAFKRNSNKPVEAPNMFKHMFCGFFFHDMDTEELRNECALYCNDLFEHVPEFKEWFAKAGDAETFPKYFGLIKDDVKKEDQVMREDLAYCPVKIFTTEYDMSAYFAKPAVRENYGKMSKVNVVGFVVSPYMVAARVQLKHKQKELWEIEDSVIEGKSAGIKAFPSEMYAEARNLPKPDPDVKRVCSKSNVTVVKGQYTHEPSKLIPYARGRTCHIVLGTAPGALKEASAEVNYGVAYAVSRAFKASKEMDIEVKDIGQSEVKRIGKYWFIYLKDTLVVDGLFASCCTPCSFDTPLQQRGQKDV